MGYEIKWERAMAFTNGEITENTPKTDPTIRFSHAATKYTPSPSPSTPIGLSYVVIHGGRYVEKINTEKPHNNDVWLMRFNDLEYSSSLESDSSEGTITAEWIKLESKNYPSKGHNRYHTMVAVGDYVYVFGNRTSGRSPRNESFELETFEIQRFKIDLVERTASWEHIQYQCTTMIPSRVGHGTSILGDGRIASFGGCTVGTTAKYFNDIIIFDPSNFTIEYIPVDALDKITERAHFGFTAHDTKIYVSGGVASSTSGKPHLFKDLIVFDVNAKPTPNSPRWTTLKLRKTNSIEAPGTPSRMDHSMVWLGSNVLFCLGGSNSQNQAILDAHAVDVESGRYVSVNMYGSSQPTPRANTTLVMLNDTTIVSIGGKKREKNSSGIWVSGHEDGIYHGTIEHLLDGASQIHTRSHSVGASEVPPPKTPLGKFKRKRSSTDSPEAPQKRLETVRLPTHQDEETKESSDSSSPPEIIIHQLKDENLQLKREIFHLHEGIRIREEEISCLKYNLEMQSSNDSNQSKQLQFIQDQLSYLTGKVDMQNKHNLSSQSTVGASQESPMDDLNERKTYKQINLELNHFKNELEKSNQLLKVSKIENEKILGFIESASKFVLDIRDARLKANSIEDI